MLWGYLRIWRSSRFHVTNGWRVPQSSRNTLMCINTVLVQAILVCIALEIKLQKFSYLVQNDFATGSLSALSLVLISSFEFSLGVASARRHTA
ncbi:hypothetical protein EJ08DRAFT_58571 [Tothia fuscella]|uniref:Uncharacterized protein n=1 Tax=Tothia fuscella TaxID=1048955 RepID=A0A9P4NXM1_9PEZI|nr:hypothetical protein EJ08DRAFT_58571 [Tothia fuscella]